MDERQKNLLKEIVETYIKTVKPVGSKSLCQKFKCSSATIRNEMAALENLGYIEKNHISSGRIPSEKGYKYYAEFLMKPKELTGEDVLKLQTIFDNKQLKLNDAITQCMEIISDITNYTSVVLGKSSNENLLQQISIIPIDEHRVVALVCTNKGIVENKQFVLPSNTSVAEVTKTCEMVNRMLVGTPIDEVSEKLEFDIKPVIMQKIEQYETVYNIFYDALHNFTKEANVHMSGQSKLFNQPEYNDTNEIRRLVSKFEDPELIKKIDSKDDDKVINIYIGDENEFDSNVTIVKSHYNINGEEGTIAVVGPKRMEYDKVVGLLKYINDNINELDKDNEDE